MLTEEDRGRMWSAHETLIFMMSMNLTNNYETQPA